MGDDDYREKFLQLFEDYLTKPARKDSDHPKNRELVADMSRIQATVLLDLWQSEGEPPTSGRHWWELWLRPTPDAVDLVERFAAATDLQVAPSRLGFDTHVVWIRARWSDLLVLPFTAVPLTELRRPQFVDTVEDLDLGDQLNLAEDLAARLVAADESAPAACLIDTGVRRSHALLRSSLAESDMHSLVGPPAGDLAGHGTQMAGLALLGPLDDLLLGNGNVRLRHRLESVKYLPDKDSPPHEPASYGVVTAQAVVVPEIAAAQRRRVYCMTITRTADRPGEPSLWSAALDALAVGTDVGRSDNGIDLLGPPDPAAARLVIVSAGNVDPTYQDDYRQHCELSPIEDPAQAWNALTVGACTSLTDCPWDPTFAGWKALGVAGDVSPHSRTGVIAGGPQWPIKPDRCMEGGGVLTDGAGVRGDVGMAYLGRTFHRAKGAAPGPLSSPVAWSDQFEGYDAYVFPHEHGHLSAVILKPTADPELSVLRHIDAFDAACRAIPGLAEWTDHGVSTPTSGVMFGGGLLNPYRGQLRRPGLLAVGDAVATTAPTAGRGIATASMQIVALLALLDADVHPDDLADTFACWCDTRIRPWVEDHLAFDAETVRRWKGQDIDLSQPLTSSAIAQRPAPSPGSGRMWEPSSLWRRCQSPSPQPNHSPVPSTSPGGVPRHRRARHATNSSPSPSPPAHARTPSSTPPTRSAAPSQRRHREDQQPTAR